MPLPFPPPRNLPTVQQRPRRPLLLLPHEILSPASRRALHPLPKIPLVSNMALRQWEIDLELGHSPENLPPVTLRQSPLDFAECRPLPTGTSVRSIEADKAKERWFDLAHLRRTLAGVRRH